MNYVLVCPIGVIGGKEDLLTYQSENALSVGSIVQIPFGSRTLLGVVMDTTKKPKFATKAIVKNLEIIIPKPLIQLSRWISDYYAVRLSITMQAVLPKGLQKSRRSKSLESLTHSRQPSSQTLTTAQTKALASIRSSDKITHLLHGVTGSGKSRIYQELARDMLKAGKSSLILVPEIALTPQLAAEFQHLDKHVLILHSRQTEAERHRLWEAILRSEHPWILVGPRSNLFSPLKNIGLIVVDECHEPSYTQDSQPRYNALRVARKLAELHSGCKLILASATPSITDYFFAVETKTPVITLDQPIGGTRPTVSVVDMRNKDDFGSHSLFSKKLLEEMNNSFVQKEQTLLFHNRRGTARMSLCSNCGWVAECQLCHLPMRLHHDKVKLQCHTCGRVEALPQVCPNCNSPHIIFQGFGSKRIESEVRKLFPTATVARFDSDTPLDEQVQSRYAQLFDGTIDIIIGTQGVAKGLDLPHLKTVGVVQADSELFIPDFSSSERSFQLLTQVIGRAGRGGQASSVIIQTLNPDNPAIKYASNQDYENFYKYEIKERQLEHVPPSCFMLQLVTGYTSATSAEKACQQLANTLLSKYPGINVRGPSPAFHEHRGHMHYWQLVVFCSRRPPLVAIARQLPTRWQYTLDPINLL